MTSLLRTVISRDEGGGVRVAKIDQTGAGDGAAGGWVRWIGRATSSRDKTSGMSLVVSL
jgi:hypothetical protein